MFWYKAGWMDHYHFMLHLFYIQVISHKAYVELWTPYPLFLEQIINNRGWGFPEQSTYQCALTLIIKRKIPIFSFVSWGVVVGGRWLRRGGAQKTLVYMKVCPSVFNARRGQFLLLKHITRMTTLIKTKHWNGRTNEH